MFCENCTFSSVNIENCDNHIEESGHDMTRFEENEMVVA